MWDLYDLWDLLRLGTWDLDLGLGTWALGLGTWDYSSPPTFRSPSFSARSLSSSVSTSRIKLVLLTTLITTGNSFSEIVNSKVPLLISIMSRNAVWPLWPLHSASTIFPSLNETLARWRSDLTTRSPVILELSMTCTASKILTKPRLPANVTSVRTFCGERSRLTAKSGRR